MAGLKVEIISANYLDEYIDKVKHFVTNHPNARIIHQTQSECAIDNNNWHITLTIFYFEE